MFGFQSFVRGATRMAFMNTPIKSANKFTFSCVQKQVTNMIAKSSPVPTLSVMNIMNLRQMIERIKEQSEMEPVLIQGISLLQIGTNPSHSKWIQTDFCLSPTINSSKLYAPKHRPAYTTLELYHLFKALKLESLVFLLKSKFDDV